MTDTPAHAEQCNHEFLKQIRSWPECEWMMQPTHYVESSRGVILLHVDERGNMYEFDGEGWYECFIEYPHAAVLHCTRDMWLAAQ